jgi:hypothetical protein
MYMLELCIAQPVCLVASTGDGAWRWHARFGHTGFIALCRMGKEEIVHVSKWFTTLPPGLQ